MERLNLMLLSAYIAVATYTRELAPKGVPCRLDTMISRLLVP
jgi:hypothetical protein